MAHPPTTGNLLDPSYPGAGGRQLSPSAANLLQSDTLSLFDVACTLSKSHSVRHLGGLNYGSRMHLPRYGVGGGPSYSSGAAAAAARTAGRRRMLEAAGTSSGSACYSRVPNSCEHLNETKIILSLLLQYIPSVSLVENISCH